MDRAAFAAWLERYVDAWRLGDPLAIGDLFSPDVRYAFGPFDEAVVGRPAVVAAWLDDPDDPGVMAGRLRGPRGRRRRVRRPRPDSLPDRRPAARSTASSPTSSSAASTTTAAAASSPSTTCAVGPEPDDDDPPEPAAADTRRGRVGLVGRPSMRSTWVRSTTESIMGGASYCEAMRPISARESGRSISRSASEARVRQSKKGTHGLQPAESQLHQAARLQPARDPLPAATCRGTSSAAKYGGYEQQRLRGKNIAIIFEKTSTRTRVAFEVAAYDQGAHVTYLGPERHADRPQGVDEGHGPGARPDLRRHRVPRLRPGDRRGAGASSPASRSGTA